MPRLLIGSHGISTRSTAKISSNARPDGHIVPRSRSGVGRRLQAPEHDHKRQLSHCPKGCARWPDELADLGATGAHAPAWPTLDDRVDAGVVATRGAWNQSQKNLKSDSLFGNLFKAIDREVAANRIIEQALPTDAPPPEDGQDQAGAMVEAVIFGFSLPVESLSLAGVLPRNPATLETTSLTPEAEEATSAEIFLANMLKVLPLRRCRALFLWDLERLAFCSCGTLNASPFPKSPKCWENRSPSRSLDCQVRSRLRGALGRCWPHAQGRSVLDPGPPSAPKRAAGWAWSDAPDPDGQPGKEGTAAKRASARQRASRPRQSQARP